MPETDLAERVRQLVDDAPPITAETRDRIAALVKAGGR